METYGTPVLLAEEFGKLVDNRDLMLSRVEKAKAKNEIINGAVWEWLYEVDKLIQEMNEKKKKGVVSVIAPADDDENYYQNAQDSIEIEKAPEGTPASGGLLVITILEAEDVEGKHHTNPYARVIFKGEERKTMHIKKSRNPMWYEEFQYLLEKPPTNERLYVEVLSASSKWGLLYPKEVLGYVLINLSDVVNNKRIEEKYHLIDSKNGRIQIELEWRTPDDG